MLWYYLPNPRSTLLPLVIFVYPLAVLSYLFVVLVFPLAVLIFLLVVFVCPLVVLEVLSVLSVGIFITNR